MHNQKHCPILRPNLSHPQCVPPLLPVGLYTVWTDKTALVLKRLDRNLKGNPTMFSPICSVFPLVPLVSHIVYTKCILDSRKLQDRILPQPVLKPSIR
jgi:hypothetical protein